MGVRIRQKDGKWYVFINHEGYRKAKCIGSNKRVAVQIQKQLEAKLALGDVGLLKEEPEVVRFGEYAEQWLHTYVETKCKPSSARVIRQIVRNHLVPALGEHAMTHLTRQHVKDFLATKRHLSPKYVVAILKVCSMLLNHALDDAVIPTNPAARLGKYLPEKGHNLYELHAPIQYVSEQLGHASITLTVNTYGHPRQGLSTHLVDQLAQPAQLSATLAQSGHRGVA